LKPGPIALVGSGEYLPVMAQIEANLISGRGDKYVQIPTAAAQEGERSLNYWRDLGIAQAQRIGVQPVPLLITDRMKADDDEYVKQIEGAGLIYFSGGNPHYLANTLRDTKLWQAIHQAWLSGAALAGCSAGAMAIANHIPELRSFSRTTTPGFALLPNVRVLPHFDRMFMNIVSRIKHDKGLTILGIDENTALVGGLDEWEVQGVGSVWVFFDGGKIQYKSGQKVVLPN
jgi:cyanophycinase-like exopeptidase